MRATVSRGSVFGFEAIALENSLIRAVVIPSLGGRTWELLDRSRKRQWIWHREDVALAASPPGSIYDDVWAGGWEELFPNDAHGDFEGRALPDHGEWWTAAWTVAEMAEGAEAVVRLIAKTRTRQTSCVKEYRLGSDADTIYVSYRIESQEPEAFHFLFKQHLPIALTPSCALVVPGGRVTPVDPAFGTLSPTAGPYEWPLARGADGHQVDLSRVPSPSSGAREFVYVSDLPEGWCGVNDTAEGASLRLHYDLRELPYLWLFLSYGGWRNCYTAVLEPCTNMPKDLSEAVRLKRSACLPAYGVFQTRLAVRLGSLPRTDE
jgi:hypothetical protein